MRMSVSVSVPALIAVFVAAAGSFFTLGAYYQHCYVLTNIQKLERRNAHAYFIRQKLYGLLNIFGVDPEQVEKAESKAGGESQRLGEIMKYGFPSMGDIRLYANYVVCFDRRNVSVQWLCERVRHPADDNSSAPANGEAGTQSNLSIQLSYVQSPSGVTLVSQSEASRVFFMANIKPFLNRGFNFHIWEKLLSYVHKLAACHGDVYIYTGSIYFPKEVTSKWYLEFQPDNNIMVAVPTHFFKIIIVSPTLTNVSPYAEAFVLPNEYMRDSTELQSLLTDIREIENLTGLRFFEGLGRNFVNAEVTYQQSSVSHVSNMSTSNRQRPDLSHSIRVSLAS